MKSLISKKRGQVTIFIIISILIVIVGILVYAFYPEIKETIGLETKNPSEFIQSCMEEIINEKAHELSLQGGYLEPEHYYLYDNSQIAYLCYTGEYYARCVMQQPKLVEHVGEEIAKGIEEEANECFNVLIESYENKGYDVELKKGDTIVELLPEKIIVTFNNSLTLTHESVEKYDSFKTKVNNDLYELLGIANSILNWEARYGDAETTTYMNYYHHLKVEKKKQTDGTTIYILTNRDNENKFQFASRSVAWPPGYGTEDLF